MARTKRVGWFGGSFDPVHVGHLGIAEDVRKAAGLDVVRFLPAGRPPHKRTESRPVASPADRLAMLELSVAGRPGLAVDPREIDDTGPSWSVKSMEAAAREEPDARHFFLIGGDSARDLPGWHRIDRLAEVVTFLVAARSGEDAGEVGRIAAAVPGLRLESVPARVFDVSSTDIRRRVAQGLPIHDLVPPSVVRYIVEKGLYR